MGAVRHVVLHRAFGQEDEGLGVPGGTASASQSPQLRFCLCEVPGGSGAKGRPCLGAVWSSLKTEVALVGNREEDTAEIGL